MTDKSEIAALRREVAELKAAQPKPEPDWKERERGDAEWRDQMHQLAEKRMANATPPSVRQYFANQDDRLVKEIALRDARAPTGPSSQGVIPSTQQLSNVHTGGSASPTPGYVEPRPLGPQPGIDLIDRAVNAALPHGPEWGKGKKGPA
jgi:hypothetical protein